MPLIESFVVATEQFAMVEGKHVNWGWKDFRDNHLAGEIEDLSKVEFRLDFKRLHVAGEMAYATFLFALSPKGNADVNYGSGRATVVLTKINGVWKILNIHTS